MYNDYKLQQNKAIKEIVNIYTLNEKCIYVLNRVWKFAPSPMTTATIMFKSPVLSIEWASKSDRLVRKTYFYYNTNFFITPI